MPITFTDTKTGKVYGGAAPAAASAAKPETQTEDPLMRLAAEMTGGDNHDRYHAAQKAGIGTFRPGYGYGNIDLTDRPVYRNDNGTISTVDSFSANIDGREVLLPQIGRDASGNPVRWTEDQAIDNYLKTGENLGTFDTVDAANNYANWLHNQQADYYADQGAPADSSEAKAIMDELSRLRDERGDIIVNYASNAPTMDQWKRQQELDAKIADLEGQLKKLGVDPQKGNNLIDAAHSVFMQGISGAAQGVTSTLDFANRLGHYALGWTPAEYDAADTFTKRLNEQQKQNVAYWSGRKAEALGDDEGARNIAELGVIAVQAIPAAISAMVSGGASFAGETANLVSAANSAGITSWVGQTADSIRNVLISAINNPQFYSSFWSVLGNGYEEAKANGASDANAVAYALTNGGINALIEIGGGIETPGESALQTAAEEATEEYAQRKFEKGLEMMYGKQNKIFSTTDPDAIFNPIEDLKASASGAFAGGLLGAGQNAINSLITDMYTGGRPAPVGAEVTASAATADGTAGTASVTESNNIMRAAQEMAAARTIPETPSAPEDINRARVRGIEEDPAQLAELGVDTQGKSGNVVRAEIRQALEAQNEQRRQAQADMVRSYADQEAAAERMTELGAKTITDFYTGGDPAAYIQGMTAAYNAGRDGKAIDSVNTSALSQIQRDAAYLAGQAAGRNAKAAQPNIDAVRQYTESEQAAGRMNEEGARIIRSYYDPSANISAEDYIQAASAAYNAGVTGADISSVTSSALTRSQRDAAYMAGRAAARQGQTAQAEAKIAEGTQVPVQAQQATADTTQIEKPTEAQKKPAVRAENPGLIRDENAQKAKLSYTGRRAMDTLAKVLGVNVRFVDHIDSGAQGYYDNGEIVIALDGDDPFLTTAVHESVHRIRELSESDYNYLRDFVLKHMADEQYQLAGAVKERTGYTAEEAPEEIIADSFGRMLGNEAMMKQFVAENSTAAQHIMDVFAEILDRIRQAMSGKDARSLTDAQLAVYKDLEGRLDVMLKYYNDAISNARKSEGVSNEGAMFSKARRTMGQAFEKHKFYNNIIKNIRQQNPTGYTAVGDIVADSVYTDVGLPAGKVYFDNSKILNELDNARDPLPIEYMQRVPEILADPTVIVEADKKNTISVFGEVRKNGVPVLVGIMVAKDRSGRNVINKIRTVHTRGHAANLINDDTILYLNENKKRTKDWFQASRINMPLGGTKFGLIRSITLDIGEVKRKFSLREVPPVEPTSNQWKRGATYDEVTLPIRLRWS